MLVAARQPGWGSCEGLGGRPVRPYGAHDEVTAHQGKIVVAATVLGLSMLLLWQALTTGGWVAFAVTEIQVLVPMGISWRVLNGW
jgi:hypothetical protein